eukprot:359159-Chlamydomonas_euryale.AAC.21
MAVEFAPASDGWPPSEVRKAPAARPDLPWYRPPNNLLPCLADRSPSLRTPSVPQGRGAAPSPVESMLGCPLDVSHHRRCRTKLSFSPSATPSAFASTALS